jgi:hypothetical protein
MPVDEMKKGEEAHSKSLFRMTSFDRLRMNGFY